MSMFDVNGFNASINAVNTAVQNIGNSIAYWRQNQQIQENNEKALQMQWDLQKDAQEYNTQQTDLSWNRMLDFYNKNSSPAALKEQYEALGWNPLMLTGGSQGSIASSPTATSSASSVPTMQPPQYTNAFQLPIVSAQVRNLNAQSDKLEADANRTNSNLPIEQQLMKGQISLAEAQTLWQNELLQPTIDNLHETGRNIHSSTLKNIVDAKVSQKTAAFQDALTRKIEAELPFVTKINELNINNLEASYKNLLQQTSNLESQKRNIDESTKYIGYNAESTRLSSTASATSADAAQKSAQASQTSANANLIQAKVADFLKESVKQANLSKTQADSLEKYLVKAIQFAIPAHEVGQQLRKLYDTYVHPTVSNTSWWQQIYQQYHKASVDMWTPFLDVGD